VFFSAAIVAVFLALTGNKSFTNRRAG